MPIKLNLQVAFIVEVKCEPVKECTTPGYVKAPSNIIKETVVILPFKPTVRTVHCYIFVIVYFNFQYLYIYIFLII